MKTRAADDKKRIIAFALVSAFLIGGCQAAPKKVLLASDIPVGIGTSYEAFQNDPGTETAEIKISAEGPWDFSDGPDTFAVKSQIVSTTKAANHQIFPGAKYAEKIFASDYTGGATAFNFAALSESSLQSFGQSVAPPGQESVYKKFSKSERLLVFPLRVGDRWTDILSVDDEAGSTYEVAKEVVARGQVKVPAGAFFDCFMIRITKSTTAADRTRTRTLIYAWWAPGTGLVAAAGSRPGEEKLYFDQAAYLFRLKNYSIK